MSNTANIYQFLKQLIEEKTGTEAITMQSHLVNDCGLDSIDVIEIMVEVENHYKINVPDYEIQDLNTVESLVKLTELLILKSN